MKREEGLPMNETKEYKYQNYAWKGPIDYEIWNSIIRYR